MRLQPMVWSGTCGRACGLTGRPVVLLDRDGALIENRSPYVLAREHLQILPHARAAVRMLNDHGLRAAVVTNQACIGKRLLSRRRAWALHREVVREVSGARGHVCVSLICPHRPDDDCPCRKPRPGMAHAAARVLGGRVVGVVGDAVSDVALAPAVGAVGVLVRTGRGRDQERGLGGAAVDVRDDVLAAAEAVVHLWSRGRELGPEVPEG